MQLTTNTTGMAAGLAVAADAEARDHCVVVVKGSFETDAYGQMSLLPEQHPLTTADEHYGDPATTAVRYECDYALAKLRTDVVVVGKAVAPQGKGVRKLDVRLEVEGQSKVLTVYGERNWVSTLSGVGPGTPADFLELPITYDRAWGGIDDSDDPRKVAVEARNLIGRGFYPHRDTGAIVGIPMPSIEAHGQPILSPRASYAPAGFGCISRVWQPRAALAGTYDASWREQRAPYLPTDFDPLYFQCAPVDQQFEHFQGGETIRCVHMATNPVVSYRIPKLKVPIGFCFRDSEVVRSGILDTIILEPDLGRALITWRASVPLRKKLTALESVFVGERPSPQPRLRLRNGKPVFAGLAATIEWLRKRDGARRVQ